MRRKNSQRFVEPFTREALRSDTKVLPPLKLKIENFSQTPSHAFRELVGRDDILSKLPMVNERHRQRSQKCRKSREDCNFYLRYLPIFFDGLHDCDEYYRKMAINGLQHLINITAQKIFTIIPSLILPIRRALATRKQEVIVATLRAIQWIAKRGPCCGEVLIRYYRNFLPLLNQYCWTKSNIHDSIDNTPDIADIVYETLEILEHSAGDQRLAYITIKRIIPTYENFYHNQCSNSLT